MENMTRQVTETQDSTYRTKDGMVVCDDHDAVIDYIHEEVVDREDNLSWKSQTPGALRIEEDDLTAYSPQLVSETDCLSVGTVKFRANSEVYHVEVGFDGLVLD